MLKAEILKISVASAELPTVYMKAQEAMEKCERVDECKKWADQALALASYARQSQDETLEKLSMRIRARAIRRAGELLRKLDGRGGDRKSEQIKKAPGGPFDRTKAAKQAGMSPRQSKQATAVSRVPQADFEAAVESDFPPGVAALAEMGRKPGFKQATKLLGSLNAFAKFCRESDPVVTAEAVMPNEVEECLLWVEETTDWIGRFVDEVSKR